VFHRQDTVAAIRADILNERIRLEIAENEEALAGELQQVHRAEHDLRARNFRSAVGTICEMNGHLS
jgi:hypothetical protein